MSRTLAIFGIKLKKDIQASILKKDKEKASKHGGSVNGNSRLSGTLKLVFDNNDSPDTLTIFMNDYWYWLNKGRLPGGVSKQGQTSISSWIKRKGLNPVSIIKSMDAKAGIIRKKPLSFAQATKQFTFIIARSIKQKGFKGNHFYDEVINDGRLDKLRKDLADEYRKEIKIIITNGSNNPS